MRGLAFLGETKQEGDPPPAAPNNAELNGEEKNVTVIPFHLRAPAS